MHRSGTSALARMLGFAGARLPDEVIAPNDFNPKGYWEPAAVVDLNDAALMQAAAAWDAPFIDAARLDDRLPADLTPGMVSVIKTAYGSPSGPIVLKDPRCTLMAGRWAGALAEAGYAPWRIGVWRDAPSVSESLARRDGFSADEAGLLWCWYGVQTLKALQACGGALISYQAMATDWSGALSGLLPPDLTGLSGEAEAIGEFLEAPRISEKADFSEPVAAIVASVTHSYQAYEQSGDPSADLAALEARILALGEIVRAALARVRAMSAKRIEEVEAERDSARSALEKADKRERRAARHARSLEAERDAAREALREADEREARAMLRVQALEHLEREFKRLEGAVASYREQAETLESELKRAQSDYFEADAERLALRADKERLAANLHAIETSAYWKAGAPLRNALARSPWLSRQLRRAAKLGWWTVSGKLPGRLRDLQRGRAGAEAQDEPAPGIGDQQAADLRRLREFLLAEYSEQAFKTIEGLIKRYGLVFQSEGRPPIDRPVGDEQARRWAGKLAGLAGSDGPGDLDAPQVSIVIPAYNQIAYTLACIESVIRSRPRARYEILVGDDRSSDGTKAAASVRIPGVRWIRHAENQGFVGNCNLTAEQARGGVVVFLNNDTLVLPGWLDELVATLESDPAVGLAGSKLIYPDGRLQEAGGIFWRDGSAWNYGRFDDPRRPEYSYAREADYISGASIAVRADLWRELGGFDELFRPAYAEDADLAFRIRARGLRTVFQPRSALLHFEGVTSGTDLASGAKAYQVENLKRFKERWSDTLLSHRENGVEPHLEKDRNLSKRALFIDVTTPEPQHDAGSLVAVEVMRALHALDFKVTFVPEDNFLWTREFSAPLQASGVECVYHPYFAEFESFIRARGAEFDLVVVHRFSAAEKVLSLLRRHARQARVVLMPADLHFLREQREAELSGDARMIQAAEATRERELAIMAAVDAVLPHSRVEIDLLKDALPGARTHLLPLVHDPAPTPAPFDERVEVGFIGGFGHPPNADGLAWFMDAVWPIVRREAPDARLVIAGSKMPDSVKKLDGKHGVEVLGFVDQLEDLFNRVRLTIAPLRFGAGAKGKVAASVAFGVPCVSTSVGVEGMGLTPEAECKVADTPEAFAAAILELSSDPYRWTAMRSAGLVFAETHTSRRVVREQISALLDQL